MLSDMCFSDENRCESLIIAQCLDPDWDFYVLKLENIRSPLYTIINLTFNMHFLHGNTDKISTHRV